MTPCCKKQAVLLWLLALPSLCFLQKEDLSLFLERQIPKWQERYRVPGAGVALIQGAQLTWVEGFGKADAAALKPVRPSTIFKAGPISTTLTAWGVMKLVEQERLDLDAPLGRYLERWQLPPSHYDHSEVTIRRLLSHSGGIPAVDYPTRNQAGQVPELKPLLSGVADNLPPIHVSYPPGNQFRYSKPGYSLLAMLIEDVTGEPFADFMKREVFRPLRMNHTYFNAGKAPESRCAAPHDALGQTQNREYDDQPAAEGLYTTTVDLARFVAAGLPNLRYEVQGYPVIERNTIERMQQSLIRISGGQSFKATHHGMGYYVDESTRKIRVLFNGGFHPPGWHSYFFAIPETGDGLVVLTNGHNGLALIHAIAEEWAQARNLNPPKIIRHLTLGKRYLWAVIVVGSILFILFLTIFLQDLRNRRRTLARSYRNPRLALVLLIGISFVFIWTKGQHLILDWHPYLYPWPQVTVSAFLGAALLLVLTQRR